MCSKRLQELAPTMEAVSLMRSRPSRPTEASHNWWGDRTREAGPRGWPFTSCTGFSLTTCWLGRPSVSWEKERRNPNQRIIVSYLWFEQIWNTQRNSGYCLYENFPRLTKVTIFCCKCVEDILVGWWERFISYCSIRQQQTWGSWSRWRVFLPWQ